MMRHGLPSFSYAPKPLTNPFLAFSLRPLSL